MKWFEDFIMFLLYLLILVFVTFYIAKFLGILPTNLFGDVKGNYTDTTNTGGSIFLLGNGNIQSPTYDTTVNTLNSEDPNTYIANRNNRKVNHSGYTWVITDDRNNPFQVTEEMYNLAWDIVNDNHPVLPQEKLIPLRYSENGKTEQILVPGGTDQNQKLSRKERRKQRREARRAQGRKHWWQIYRKRKPSNRQDLVGRKFKSNERLVEAPIRINGNEAEEKARKIFDWMVENIPYGDTKRGMVGYRTSNEVLNTHEGVCGEHAILFCALGRIVGLRTQYVSVKVDYRGRDVYHACAGIWVGDRWLQADVAYKQFDIHHQEIEVLTDEYAVYRFKNWR